MEKGEKIFNIFNIIFMVFFLSLIIFPLINIIALSLNDGYDAMKGGIYLAPRKFTLINYETILKDLTIYRAFAVTVAKTVIGVAGHLLITGIAAYAMSKPYLMGRKIFIRMGVITMFFSGGMIPTFLVVKSLGLANSFWVFIIPVLFSFYDMVILMNFFKNLPESIEESAKIDGAHFFQIFFKIVLPLSVPVIATIALFHGVYQWNDFFVAKLYITDKSLYPIQYYLYQMLTSAGAANSAKAGVYVAKAVTTQSLQQATMIVTTLPIMLIYPFLQKYFISGMLLGGVKE
ncbi:carbohydrate ABC transporter permease [Paenibacillus thiaminolyticus]|uniref:Carbohydrate ABC transporter permease n=1 Tax=Paenibacillus thiaminolyticus TaxID=49283 RepID=A0A3A3GK74_PANTH|nr:carbohydrate ABC transporter permease [Paenibacillus thiaminolyticus]RJG25263.1 carbohydrate ABC transporter permease [Paenibacillus thiaminolyticus]